jgi:hypothetical protein
MVLTLYLRDDGLFLVGYAAYWLNDHDPDDFRPYSSLPTPRVTGMFTMTPDNPGLHIWR